MDVNRTLVVRVRTHLCSIAYNVGDLVLKNGGVYDKKYYFSAKTRYVYAGTPFEYEKEILNIQIFVVGTFEWLRHYLVFYVTLIQIYSIFLTL